MQHKEITEYLDEFQKFQEDLNKIGAVSLQQNWIYPDKLDGK